MATKADTLTPQWEPTQNLNPLALKSPSRQPISPGAQSIKKTQKTKQTNQLISRQSSNNGNRSYSKKKSISKVSESYKDIPSIFPLGMTKYYIFSSHNTEIITSQIRGVCSLCAINEFITNDNPLLNGGCIELDFNGVSVDKNGNLADITIGHMCSITTEHENKNVETFSKLLPIVIEKYKSGINKVLKPPLIISVDANLMHKKIPVLSAIPGGQGMARNTNVKYGANTPEFYEMWHGILSRNFANNEELRPDFEITPATPLDSLCNRILIRWDYASAEHNKGKNCYKPAEIDRLSRLNLVKGSAPGELSTVSYPVGRPVSSKVLEKIQKNCKTKLVRTYPEPSIYNYNYNFTKPILAGSQIVAINLQLQDMYALGYAAFFKYSHIIPIPLNIQHKSQLPGYKPSTISRRHPMLSRRDSVISGSFDETSMDEIFNSSTSVSEYNKTILLELEKDIKLLIDDTKSPTKVIDDIYFFISSSTPNFITESSFSNDYVITISTSKGNYTIKFNHKFTPFVLFSDNKTHTRRLSIQVGGSDSIINNDDELNTNPPKDDLWDDGYISATTTQYILSPLNTFAVIEFYNLFNPEYDGNKPTQLYNHYDNQSDHNIFNILYIRYKENNVQFHGCANLSQTAIDIAAVDQAVNVPVYPVNQRNIYKYGRGCSVRSEHIVPVYITKKHI